MNDNTQTYTQTTPIQGTSDGNLISTGETYGSQTSASNPVIAINPITSTTLLPSAYKFVAIKQQALVVEVPYTITDHTAMIDYVVKYAARQHPFGWKDMPVSDDLTVGDTPFVLSYADYQKELDLVNTQNAKTNAEAARVAAINNPVVPTRQNVVLSGNLSYGTGAGYENNPNLGALGSSGYDSNSAQGYDSNTPGFDPGAVQTQTTTDTYSWKKRKKK